ncbi:SDR family NAD(P)-dependent oxidoreductase [Streptomyces sp. L7]
MSTQRVALVTGSSSGIGEAVARRLAAENIRVVINSARSVEEGEKLAATLPGRPLHTGRHRRRDAGPPPGRRDRRALRTARHPGQQRRHHPIRPARRPGGRHPEIWREILGTNVIGTWQTTVAAVPHLKAAGDAVVVNVSSVAGSRPAGSSVPYAVSKAAIEHITRLLANVLGPEVRVNAVAPGLIETPWTKDFTEIAEHVRRSAPLRRVGAPEDVADAVYGLVSSAYTTGAVLSVDGGAHLL